MSTELVVLRGNSGNRCCISGYYEAIMVQTLQALRYGPGHGGIETAGGNRGEDCVNTPWY